MIRRQITALVLTVVLLSMPLAAWGASTAGLVKELEKEKHYVI